MINFVIIFISACEKKKEKKGEKERMRKQTSEGVGMGAD